MIERLVGNLHHYLDEPVNTNIKQNLLNEEPSKTKAYTLWMKESKTLTYLLNIKTHSLV